MKKACLASALALSALLHSEDPQCCVQTRCCEEGYFFVNGSFLYVNPQINGLRYASHSQTTIADTTLGVSATGEFAEPQFKWKPGVRASIGYSAYECGSSIYLAGTYFRSKVKDSIVSQPILFTQTEQDYWIPLWSPATVGFATEGASEEWKLTFGTLDLLFGGVFNPWSCVKFKPNIGLRGLWIDQHLNVSYTNAQFLTVTIAAPPVAALAQSRYHSKYRAIGFKAGFDFAAPLYCDFSLVGGASGSLVYGNPHITTLVNGFNLITDSAGTPILLPVISQGKEKIHKLTPNLESELGLSYDKDWSCWGIGLSARYFFSIWFDQNNFDNLFFTSPPVNGIVNGQALVFGNFGEFDHNNSNLFFQGLEIRAEIRF